MLRMRSHRALSRSHRALSRSHSDPIGQCDTMAQDWCGCGAEALVDMPLERGGRLLARRL
jgi:hypothetical protein